MIFKKIISSDCLIITSSYFLRFLKVILNNGYIRTNFKYNHLPFKYKQNSDLMLYYNNKLIIWIKPSTYELSRNHLK